MPVPSRVLLAEIAAQRAEAVEQMAARLGDMTPGPGQYAVTIRVDRPDGQFVTSTCLVPADLMTAADRGITRHAETSKVIAGFVSAYQRASELAE